MMGSLENKIIFDSTSQEPKMKKGSFFRRLKKKPEVKSEATTPQSSAKKPRRKMSGKKKFFLLLFFVVLLIMIVIPVLTVPTVLQLRDDVDLIASEAAQILPAVQEQDLVLAKEKVEKTNSLVDQLKTDYQKIAWTGYVPYFGAFYRDGGHAINAGQHLLAAGMVTVESLMPYADILGFDEEGEQKTTAEMTAEDRLLLALDTLDKIQPNMDEISQKISLAQQEIDQIDPSRYPEEIAGRRIREKVVTLINTIDNSAELAAQIKPVVGFLKPLMGVPDKKNYLLLFQNDAELRPTGGFMTAYALLSVHNGKLTAGASHDIYTLDNRYGNRVPAPEPIAKFLPNVNYWHIRDMNLSPDFAVSMDQFWQHANHVIENSEIDGIIAVDTKVLVDIMEVLGPIGVAGWGNFSAENDPRCDCPQVFYELESYADRPAGTIREERKGIIGPLMHSILLNVMGSPRKKWPEFFNVALSNLKEKHILLYFFDQEIQESLQIINAGGKIKDFEGDYLHVNDTNFGGAKSNMFIEQSVIQDIEVRDDGSIVKTVTIDYRNPAPPSDCNLERGELCLNGLYRDWLRLYVPQGSELIEVTGSEIEADAYEELGKTVFEAFYGNKSPLRPQGKAQVVFKYRLPFKATGNEYRLMIQKQPGTKNHEYTVRISGQEYVFDLESDQELRLAI